MPFDSYLYTIAEISVALVGFSAIVNAIQGQHRSLELASFSVLNILTRGLMTTVLALLPVLIYSLTDDVRATWQMASGFASIYLFWMTYHARDFFKSLPTDAPIDVSTYVMRNGTNFVAGCLLAANTYYAGPTIYLFGITWCFVITVLLFYSFIHTGMNER
jgi:hypothetical protein